MQDREDNWFTLLDRMKAGAVVPVVGPDLLTLPDGRCLYDAVGSALLESVGGGIEPDPGSPWTLFSAVSQALVREPGTVDKLRRKLARRIVEHSPPVLPEPLVALANIEAFSLFVSLTCDDWLARAVQAADPGAYRRAFAIRSGTAESALDIPAPPPRRGVYQLLGSAENLLDFAVHDGDALEYLYRLQSEHGRAVRLLLGELRKRDLLLIGCRLPDWFGRSLLRLASGDALGSKATQDYVCGNGDDPELTRFLARHSPNTLVFDGDAAAFVAELAARWQPLRPGPTTARRDQPGAARAADAIVFVSYASEDAAEARAIADQLLAFGAGDVWLDKRQLRAGDDWSERIDEAIGKRCRYFLPVLSSRADARDEGVFWEEWGLGLQRSARIAGRFLLPTVIDEDPQAFQQYRRIGRENGTSGFFGRHLLSAPGGRFTDTAAEDLRQIFGDSGA